MQKYIIKFKNILVLYVFFLVSILIYIARDQWFFYDDFDLISNNRGVHISFNSVFRPHNEHTVAVPYLIYQLIFQIFKINSYIPYISTALMLFGLSIIMLYVYLRTIGVSSLTSFISAVFYSCNPAYYENTFWAFQMGLYISIIFGFLGLVISNLSISHKNLETYYIIFLTLSLFSSSLGIIFALLGLILSNNYSKKIVLIRIIPLFFWLIWFFIFGTKVDLTTEVLKNFINNFPNFLITGIFEALSNSFINLSLGILFFLILVGIAIANSRIKELYIIYSFLVSVIIFWAMLTYARANIFGEFNVNLATASRYTLVTYLLLSIPMAIGLDNLLKLQANFRIAIIFLLLFYTYWGIISLNSRANQQEKLEKETSAIIRSLIKDNQYLGTEVNEIDFKNYSMPQLDSKDIIYFQNVN